MTAGVGIGFILAGLLLLVFAQPRQPSRAEIERLAREMGMGYRTDFVIYGEPEPQPIAAANKNPPPGAQPGQSNRGAAGEAPATASEIPVLSGDNTAGSLTSSGPAKQQAFQSQIVTVIIPKGANLHQIAQMLYAQKLIDETGAFERLAQEKGLSRRLIAGEYQVELPVTPEELVRILSGQ